MVERRVADQSVLMDKTFRGYDQDKAPSHRGLVRV